MGDQNNPLGLGRMNPFWGVNLSGTNGQQNLFNKGQSGGGGGMSSGSSSSSSGDYSSGTSNGPLPSGLGFNFGNGGYQRGMGGGPQPLGGLSPYSGGGDTQRGTSNNPGGGVTGTTVNAPNDYGARGYQIMGVPWQPPETTGWTGGNPWGMPGLAQNVYYPTAMGGDLVSMLADYINPK